MPSLLSFPKFFYPTLSTDELAITLSDIGFDGVDILVRESAWVKPDNLLDTLPTFVKAMHGKGLKTPSVSIDWQHHEMSDKEDIYRLFADEGVDLVRIWFQNYRGSGTFHTDWKAARENMVILEQLGQRTGIKTLIQNHMGNLVWSAETAYFMVEGFDPDAVGIHYDPGNMIYGEGWSDPVKVLDVLGPYLALVGIKNGGWFHVPQPESGCLLKWQPSWLPVDQGMIDYAALLHLLKSHAYSGSFVMHNFYDRCSLSKLIEATRYDVRYIQQTISSLWST